MKTVSILILGISVWLAPMAGATTRTTQIYGDSASFYAVSDASLDPGKLYYTVSRGLEGGLAFFGEWTQLAPQETQDLALYPNYKEPTITSKDVLGLESSSTLTLRIFNEKTKLLLQKAPSQINLKQLIRLDMIQKFTAGDSSDANAPVTTTVAIRPDQVMPVAAASGRPITNFDECNQGGDFFERPKHETALQSTIHPQRAWCGDSEHSLCVESCSRFQGIWENAINGVNAMLPADQKKDNGIADQFEVRYFTNEGDLALPVSLKELTHLDTPVRGGVEINMFYFDQIIQFGKVIAVLQDAPGNPGATVMTTFFVVAVKQRNFDQVNAAMFPPDNGDNSGGSITSGLPSYSRHMINVIADQLEK